LPNRGVGIWWKRLLFQLSHYITTTVRVCDIIQFTNQIYQLSKNFKTELGLGGHGTIVIWNTVIAYLLYSVDQIVGTKPTGC